MVVILYISCSLDGKISKLDGSVDFLDRFNHEGVDHGYGDLMMRIGAIVMGNRTFQQFKDHPDFFRYYEGKELYVFTRKMGMEHPKVNFVTDTPQKFIKMVDSDIWLLGGGELVASFHNEGLIDEYIISILPLVLGDGLPLFPNAKFKDLLLSKAVPYKTGIVNLHYKKAT